MVAATILDLCLDANDADRMERFWAAVLGYELVRDEDGPSYLTAPTGDLKVWINQVPEKKSAKNRVHLDVHCADVADLLALGATVDRPPDETDHWWSLLSPEGDEFCAFVRAEVPANRLYEVVVDASDARAQADWWSELLGGRANHQGDGSFLDQVSGMPFDYLVFQAVPEPKTAKNRVHLDVRADLEAVVGRGGTVLREPVPGDTSWHVVADPEGNELCVFPPA
jgi:catechol 2,3-dioxygenase-like lactoylglutathione lyase family enzyme